MLRIARFLRSEDGPTAVEYAVMLALIVGVCIAGIGLAGAATADSFQDSLNQLTTTINGGAGDGGGAGGDGGGAGGQ